MKSIKWINILRIIIAILAIYFFFIYILKIPVFFLISLCISTLIVYILSFKKNIITLFLSIWLVVFNILLLLFFLIPTYSKKISLNWFYEDKKNIVKIQINDDLKLLKDNNSALYIINETKPESRPIQYDLSDPKKDWIQIELFSWDIVSFRAKTKNLKTLVNIYLWDWTIIRLFPQTTISLDKLLKNSENILNSKTQIKINQGTIWFSIIKTIVDDEWFNVITDNWTLVIRWTSWLISQNWQDIGATNTLVYSNDHLMEFKNQSQSKIINQWERYQFNENNQKEVGLNQFERMLGNDINQKVLSFKQLDKQDINNYIFELKQYVIKKFWWSFQWRWSLETIWNLKLQLLAQVDKKYEENLENFTKYKLLLWEQSNSQTIKNKTNDLFFTPVNDQLERIKNNHIKENRKKDFQYSVTYILNASNSVLNKWEIISKTSIQNIEKYINTQTNKDRNSEIENLKNNLKVELKTKAEEFREIFGF